MSPWIVFSGVPAGAAADKFLRGDLTWQAFAADYGLAFYAAVTTYTDPTHFKSTALIGKGDNFFKGFSVYVVRDAGGAGEAPQGEMKPIGVFTSVDGTCEHTAFTVPLAVTDELLVLHPFVANLLELGAANIPADVDVIRAAVGGGLLQTVYDNVGVCDVDTLTSLRNKLGNPTTDFATSIANQLFELPLPATAFTTQIVLTTVAGNKALGSITIAGLPVGAIVTHLFMYVKFGSRENTNAAVNSVAGAQNIQAKKDAGAFSTGIALAGGEYSTPLSSVAGGDVMFPTADLVGLAPANGSVITFQWTNALAAQNNLNVNDIQVSLKLFYGI